MREDTVLLAAASTGDDTARLALADLWEEAGDPRAAWARSPEVFPWILPDGSDPTGRILSACLETESPRRDAAREAAKRLGGPAVLGLLGIIATGEYEYWAGEAIGEMPREAVEPHLPGILRLLEHDEEDQCLPAMLALRALGPAAAPALPRLVAMMPPENSEEEWPYEEDGNAIGEAVACLGPTALPAVPALMRLWDYYEDEADDALAAIGPAAVPAMLAEIARLDDETKALGARKPLQRLAGEAQPALRSALRDGSASVRLAAALALARHDSEAAMPALLDALEDRPGENWVKDERIAEVLADIAPVARPPTDRLAAVLPRLADSARTTVARLLEHLGEADGALDVLRALLVHVEPERRAAAARTLAYLDGTPPEVLDAGAALLDDEDKAVRDGVKEMLAGRAGEAVLAAAARNRHEDVAIWALDRLFYTSSPALREGLEHAAPAVRLHAVRLLHGKDAAVLRAVGDPDAAVRAAAVWALAETPRSEEAEAAVRAALSDADPGVRRAALRASAVLGLPDGARLAESDPDAEARQLALLVLPESEAVAVLHRRLRHEEDAAAAAYALADFGERAQEAIPDLLPLLPGLAGEGASLALGRIGPAAIPSLVRAIEGDGYAAQLEACRVLGEMGEAASPAVPALLAALASDGPALREEAARVLSMCAPPGTATDALLPLLEGQNANTTEHALAALARIGGEPWPAHLLEARTDDVAACAAWAAGRLLPADEAVALWRGLLESPRDCLRRAAALELHRAGLGPAPSPRDLFETAIVNALRPYLADILAVRATTEPEAFAAALSHATASHHGLHAVAVEVLRRVGHLRPDESADTLSSALSTCSERHWKRAVIRALEGCAPLVPGRSMPVLRMLAEGGPGERGPALALIRRIAQGPNPVDDPAAAFA